MSVYLYYRLQPYPSGSWRLAGDLNSCLGDIRFGIQVPIYSISVFLCCSLIALHHGSHYFQRRNKGNVRLRSIRNVSP